MSSKHHHWLQAMLYNLPLKKDPLNIGQEVPGISYNTMTIGVVPDTSTYNASATFKVQEGISP